MSMAKYLGPRFSSLIMVYLRRIDFDELLSTGFPHAFYGSFALSLSNASGRPLLRHVIAQEPLIFFMCHVLPFVQAGGLGC